MILTSLTVEVGDIVIESEVKDKQEAREEYEDAVARGDTATMVGKREYLIVKIGQLLPNQQAILRLKII